MNTVKKTKLVIFRVFLLLLSALMIVLSISLTVGNAFAASESESSYANGDVSLDGKVNLKDAILVQRYVGRAIGLSEEQLKYADVNNDGKINLKDALIIQRIALGKLTIAEIAAAEKVGTTGEKYWTGCQAWIKAMGGPVGADWCSIFAGWCIEQAGYEPTDYGWAAGSTTWERQAKNAGIWENNITSPKLGYAAIFNDGAHTGIVIEIFDGGIVCAEGNSGSSSTSPWFLGSSVQHNRHYFSYSDIDGYVKLPTGTYNTETGSQGAVSKIRTAPPEYGNKNYMPTNMGGYNPFTDSINMFPSIHGRGPNKGNCTSYAWGRTCEVFGLSVAEKLPTGNACNWYGQWSGNKGQKPKPGAIAVWSDGSAGHVAFVEEMYDDGSILLSQSDYTMYFFKSIKVTKEENYGSKGTFLGFIYPD